MTERILPIYPSPDDLVFLIDAMIDVAGSYSRGILYRFGEHLGERYASRIESEGLFSGEPMRAILGTLGASGWFHEFSLDVDQQGARIMLRRPFEMASRASDCDLMRGFLSGIGRVFQGLPTFYTETRENDWSTFIGTLEAEK